MGHTPSKPSSVSSFSRTEKLGRVRVTLRRLACIFGSPNHWGVVVEADSGWVSIQFEGSIGVTYHSSYTSAALDNWGCKTCDIRTSCYGYAYSNLTLGDLLDHIEKLKRDKYSTYILVFRDCQNFARNVVDYLTGKWVGAFPIEDGPDILYYA